MIKKHVSLTETLINKINNYCTYNNLEFSQGMRKVLEAGFDNIELEKSINLNNALLDKIYSKQVYMIDLIEQFYTDMEIEKVLNPKNNKALQKFKNGRNRDINYDK